MTCEKLEHLLVEDVSLAEDAEVRKHLHECANCRSLYRDLKEISELKILLRNQATAPPDFAARVLERTEAASRFGLQWRLALFLLALLLLGPSLMWLQEQGGRSNRGPSRVEAASHSIPSTATYSLDAAGKDGLVSNHSHSPYVDIILENSSQKKFILRVPSTIEINWNQMEKRSKNPNLTHVSY